MLHRANQIVHLSECINKPVGLQLRCFKDIKKLDIHITTWNLEKGVDFNMLWINDSEITLDIAR